MSIRKLGIGGAALVLWVALLGALALPALAAAPEAPVTAAPAAKSSSAVLQGVVNPLKRATVGWFFEYKAGAVCTGESSTPVEGPAEVEAQPVTAGVEGLAPGTEYTVCLLAENAAKEVTPGTPVSFTTVPTPNTDEVKPFAATTATLNGHLTLNSVDTQYSFNYNAGGECTGGSATPTADAGTGAGNAPQATAVTGLLPGTQYTVCFVTSDAFGSEQGLAVPFTTLVAQPVIASEYTSQVNATSATLGAQIDPGGGETTYHFDYGTTAAYGQSTPESASIGADNSNHSATAQIQGLQPGTTYHYRVIATNSKSSAGGTLGADRTLTTPTADGQNPGSTQSGGCANEQQRAEQPYGLGLPDCRAYEMVSPIEKNDKDAIYASCFHGEWGSRGAVSGEAIAFDSPGSFANPSGSRLCDTYVSRRGPDGWSTQNVTPPHRALEEDVGALAAPPFDDMYFTPELSQGLVTEQTTALTSDTPSPPNGETYIESMYLEDFSGPSFRHVESGPLLPLEGYVHIQPQSSSTDLSHVLLENLSEWVDGATIPVNVGNNRETLRVQPGSGAYDGAETSRFMAGDTWHAMSEDGKRVFMTSEGGFHSTAGRELLYVRENPEQPPSPLDGQGRCTVPVDACTVLISGSHRKVPDPNGPYPVVFAGASADGSKVFFTSRSELTKDAYTGPEDNRPNLYEYDLESEELKDLTVDEADPKGADVVGVVEISKDGSYVYFVAMGKLAEGATAGQPNLYISHDGSPAKFIATLANAKRTEELEAEGNEIHIREEEEATTGHRENDESVWGLHVQENKAAVSPSGSELAFISERSLTGYDNERAENSNRYCGEANRCYEVYLYDASSGLICASCNPSGARPLGGSELNSVQDGETVQVMPHNFSEDGSRLFFQTYDALVPHDSNAHQDVYEYEGGHVYPISNVADGHDSYFLDASANGDNVFIATAGQLLPQDKDSRIDIYDARVGGGFPVVAVPLACGNGDACKPPPTLQPGVFGASGSATFSGAGNVAPLPVVKAKVKTKAKPKRCKHGYVRKRRGCVKMKVKRSGSHSKRGSK